VPAISRMLALVTFWLLVLGSSLIPIPPRGFAQVL